MCCGGCFVFLLVFWNIFFSSLDPNQYGLLKSTISGTVSEQTQRGGIKMTGPFRSFLRFPATQTTFEFSSRSPDRPPIQARTGEDSMQSTNNAVMDQQSGGQPIQISCAFQYVIVPSYLRQIYLSFGSYAAAKQRWLLLSGNMVSNVAQQFTPQDFWTDRKRISDTMRDAINNTLWENGYVMVTKFQIMKVDFADQFEDSITAVQVAEQQRVVNEYLQQVQAVVQTIEVLGAENNATIANISAGAAAYSKEITAAARRDAFNLKQSMKATKYAELKTALSLSENNMREYFKIKALQAQGTRGKLVVGLASVGSTSAEQRNSEL